MVRLNADLIWKSPHFFNAIKERELDLRGNKIAIIENIGATEDQFDTIDLSDNDIVMLENFHFMNCFGTLLINSNRITYINHNLGEFLHKMHTLVLTNNCLTSLAEIDPLVSLPKLQFLSLLDNTVTKQPDYRLYVIHKLKHLRLLDFKEVKQQEKTEAARKFHSKETDEAEKRIAMKSYTPGHVVDSEGTTKNQGAKVISPTPAQITAIKEFLEADLDSIYDTLSHIESYIYQNFERAPFNFILSWRKRLFHGMHILPPPRRQESDDCAYHATLALMECGFKVMYANRLVGTQEFNIKLSHKHLKQLVHDYVSSKEGKGFNPRDLLLVCLRMAMRHGVISEEDYDMGRLREAIRYHILSYTELSADEIRDIPGMLFDDAKMVLTSFRVTPRYRALLPHEIYRYVPSEDPACQPWTGDKKPSHVSHCVVLTGPGLAYRAPEDCETEAELSTPERYFEYLNSYSSGYGVDGCGFIFADSIRNCYTVDV